MPYNKTIWVDDSAPYIDSTNLNNIESGLEAAHAAIDGTGIGDLRYLGSTTIEDGVVRSGQGIRLDLSAPAEDVVVVVEKQGGSTTKYENEFRMDFADIFDILPKMRTQFLQEWPGETLQLRLADNTPTTGSYPERRYKVEVLPSNGNWNGVGSSILANSGLLNISKMESVKIKVQPTDDTSWAECYAQVGNLGIESGRGCAYNLNKPPNHAEDNAVKQLRLGYKNPTWLSGLQEDEVIFHVYNESVNDTYIYTSAQVIGNIDEVNGRIYGKNVVTTGADVWQQPIDVAGPKADGHSYLKKGKKLTGTEMGVDIITASVGTVVSFAGVPTYSNSWSNYNGGILKIWDGTDSTKYRVMVLANPNGTTNCTAIDSVSVNGYSFADGTHSDYELWLWYDPTIGENGTDPLSLPAWGTGDWGLTRRGVKFGGTDSNMDARALGIRPDSDINWQRQGIEFAYTSDWSGFTVPGVFGSYESYGAEIDYSAMKNRFGETDLLKLAPGETWNAYWWYTMFATDPSGTNYAQWQKDARLVTSSEGHASDANTWIRRNCIKYDSGYWWINISGADDPNNTTTARWSSDSTIADAFAALYQGENWLGLPTLTSMSDNVEAFSKYTEAINVTYDFGGITDNGLWAHNDTTSDWQISKTLVRVNYQNDEKAAREINGFRIFPAPDSFGGLDGRVKYFLNNEGTSISVIIDSTAAESTLNTNTLPGVKISVFGRLKA